jgi:hypothetical protein
MADLRLQAKVLGGVAAFLLLAATVYELAADEHAGTTMLALAAALALVVAAYLRTQAHDGGDHEDGDEYLPHASIWPFAIGVAAFLMANGLILGPLWLVPGGLLLVVGVVGFARQTRWRA